ncbi:MAG: hypothetical protein ABIP71_15330, partial [Verrucomicrobiota bacterium]
MSLSIGGLGHFLSIVLAFMPLFLLVTLIALICGAFLSARRRRWSLLVGTLSGFAGGAAILVHVASQI